MKHSHRNSIFFDVFVCTVGGPVHFNFKAKFFSLCFLWFKRKWTQNWLLTVFKYSTTLLYEASWIYIARNCRFSTYFLFEMFICLNNSKYKFATRNFCDCSWLSIKPIFLLKISGTLTLVQNWAVNFLRNLQEEKQFIKTKYWISAFIPLNFMAASLKGVWQKIFFT